MTETIDVLLTQGELETLLILIAPVAMQPCVFPYPREHEARDVFLYLKRHHELITGKKP